MARHAWTDLTLPPIVVIGVIACVWYAVESRPTQVPTQAAAAANATESTSPQPAPRVAAATPAPQSAPIVKKLGKEVQFSMSAMPYKNVQKVEFYIEKQFVGAAYSQPYTVAVNENDLTAGSHTVTAKIYTDGATTQSSAVSFTAQPSTPPAPAIDTSDNPESQQNTSGTTTAPTTNAPLAAPTNIVGTSSTDGTSATLTWDEVSTASGYRVIRDGALIATTTGVGYSDTQLTPGLTYDYQIVAISADGTASSEPSATLAVTTTTPPQDGQASAAPNPNPQSYAPADPATSTN